MPSEDESRPQRPRVQRQLTKHLSHELLVSRPDNEPSSSGRGRRTASVQPRSQDVAHAHTLPLRPQASRRVTPRDSNPTERGAGETLTTRLSMAFRRPRHSSSATRLRTTAGVLARARGATAASVRRPSHSSTTHPHEDAASFSLAGPGPQETLAANQPFVHPAYADLNPEYENPVNVRPVWGLAKPLPRVVRPGMVPTVNDLRQTLAEVAGPSTRNAGQDAGDLEQGHDASVLHLDTVTDQLEVARERRESRLLARIATDLVDLGVIPNEPRTMLTPPSEVLEEEDRDEHEYSDDASLLPFPSVKSPLDHSKSETGTPSDAGTTRQAYFAPRIRIDPGDDYAPSVKEDLELDPELVAHELQRIEAIDFSEVHNDHTRWSVYRTRYREPLAELLAVIIQLTIGFCVDLAFLTSSSTDSTSWAWGLATMTAVYVAGGISGAHLNPAISIMLYIYRGFPPRKLPSYISAQILGAFIATFIAYGLYRKDIVAFGGPDLALGGTAGAFITFPRYEYVDGVTAFFNEFVGTAVLAVAVLALGDDSNAPPGAGMSAFIIGLVVVVLSQAFGMNTGAALNPSRDFGPRVALLVIGYGGDNLFRNGYWVYGPWVATILGAIVGAFVYDVAIFVGGESPVNYPRRNVKKAGKNWRLDWADRFGG